MIKVLFICHGNICRSTMVESVFIGKGETSEEALSNLIALLKEKSNE